MEIRDYIVLNESARRLMCKREWTPFRNYVGQNAAVEKLLDLAYQGYSNPYREVPENVMLAGPPSTGKTTLVKMLAEMLHTPVVITDSSQVNSGVSFAGIRISGGPDTVIHLILDAWARDFYPLEGIRTGSFVTYTVPPMMVFIDEIHGLNRKTADAFLKATERADGMLFGKSAVLDCKSVLFVGATTDWGKLPPAFRTRFIRIDLEPPTQEEVAKIVEINTGWGQETCQQVVFYGSIVPREALAFARTIQRYAERTGAKPPDCVWECAKREGIDQWGMRKQRLEILKVLAANPNGLILRNLSSAVCFEAEELVKHWLPPLLFSKPSLVGIEGGAYVITEAGKAELAKREL